MTRDEIENAVALATDADTSHETPQDWYGAYGWHLTTEAEGDVTLDAVDYEWLDEQDETVIERLTHGYEECVGYDGLTPDEAESIIEKARTVREAAESVCGLLDEAVAAYEARDLERCRKALLAAYSQESEAGDSPATQSLADALLYRS